MSSSAHRVMLPKCHLFWYVDIWKLIIMHFGELILYKIVPSGGTLWKTTFGNISGKAENAGYSIFSFSQCFLSHEKLCYLYNRLLAISRMLYLSLLVQLFFYFKGSKKRTAIKVKFIAALMILVATGCISLDCFDDDYVGMNPVSMTVKSILRKKLPLTHSQTTKFRLSN